MACPRKTRTCAAARGAVRCMAWAPRYSRHARRSVWSRSPRLPRYRTPTAPSSVVAAWCSRVATPP
eukprot:8051348-Lingulodinium_polyedra.AAC.1